MTLEETPPELRKVEMTGNETPRRQASRRTAATSSPTPKTQRRRSAREHGDITRHWYWVTLALATTKKRDHQRPTAVAEVVYNSYLFLCASRGEAVRRGRRYGRLHEGDDLGSLTLFGAPAKCEFLGFTRVDRIDGELLDGCELGYDIQRQSIGALRKKMRRLDAKVVAGD